jgi:lipopolysaccharide transport system permease protein
MATIETTPIDKPLAYTATADARHAAVLSIQPSRGWVSLKLRDLWEYRELMYFLVWRDVKVRYKQTALGVAWVVLQPILTTIIFTVIFGNLAKMPSDNLPYAVFALAGIVPWNFFSGAITRGSMSLVGNAGMISKVYFPRLVMPTAAVMAGIVDLAIVLVLLFGLMIYFGVVPTLAIVTLPLFLLLALVTALGVSLWLAALNVRYRDVNYIVPFITQFWLYATPVVYPSSLIPDKWRILYGLNPMAGVVEGFRWAVLGTNEAPGPMLAVSVAISAFLLISGAYFFRRVERTFADVI